ATKLEASSRQAYAATRLRIEIPVIKVDTSVVGVESKKGNWDISWLQDQVGWLNGTAYPTWKGNSVLTAHVVNADGKPGVFSRLKALGVGEYIFVYNAGYRYTYQVLSNTFIQPDDSRVMKHEEKSHLTLITCDTYDEKTGKYLRYVMVRAVLVDTRLIR
ncbi:MAG: sortase, partial [Anaerolineales bacterium]